MQASEWRGSADFKRAPGVLLPLVCATIALALGSPVARAQSAIPDIRGTYEGLGRLTSQKCPDLSGGDTAVIVTIPIQQGQSFTGSVSVRGETGAALLTGTTDASGQLNGTYSIQKSDRTDSGTFTGLVSPNQIQINGSGIETIPRAEMPPLICDETFTITATRAESTGSSADLSISSVASPSPVASGNRITHTISVSNAGPNDASGVLVSATTPSGTTFFAATASQGQCHGPGPGSTGNVVCILGTLGTGAIVTVTLTANVLAPGGSMLVDSALVASALSDPNLANNSTTISTPVAGGAIIKLVFDEPPPTVSNPTPAPQNLRVELAGQTTVELASQVIVPQDSCTLIAINIYKSNTAPVQPIPTNLWVAIPPTALQATLAAAPGGSFFVMTNVWKCGDTIIESGISNQAEVPAGPSITSLKLTAKLKALGSGFADAVQVFVNGVGFVKNAIARDSTLVIQKGPLSDGTVITGVGARNTVLITLRNPDGGVGSFAFQRP